MQTHWWLWVLTLPLEMVLAVVASRLWVSLRRQWREWRSIVQELWSC